MLFDYMDSQMISLLIKDHNLFPISGGAFCKASVVLCICFLPIIRKPMGKWSSVIKIPRYGEKPRDIGGIGRVDHVQPPLYKSRIGVRGAFKAPNGNEVRTEDPMYHEIYHAALALIYKREGAPLV